MHALIDGDTLGRAWIEVSSTNPEEVDRLRPAMIAFLAADRDRVTQFVGTGWVLAGDHEAAVVITARHVLMDGVRQVQRLHPESARSALFVPDRSRPSLDPKHLKAVWMGQHGAGLLDVVWVSCNDTTDIAICVIAQPSGAAMLFVPSSVPLQLAMPVVGQTVQMVSNDQLRADELSPPEPVTYTGQALRLHRRLSIRLGTVTGVYPHGLRGFPWPCFTTTIPAEPGMSGGFVCIPRPFATVAACGVVSADASAELARTDSLQPGESIVAATLPALGLPLPEIIGAQAGTLTLLELMTLGRMPLPVDGLEHSRS